jgi:hypothetical protein
MNSSEKEIPFGDDGAAEFVRKSFLKEEMQNYIHKKYRQELYCTS